MGGRSRALKGCNIATAGTYKDIKEKVPQWINHAGGQFQNRVTKQTTHLLVSEKAWKSQIDIVKQAHQLNDAGAAIKLVTYSWIEDSASDKGKKREGPYLCEKVWSLKKDKSKAAKKATEGVKESEGPKSHVGMLAEVFQESTDKFVDEREKKQIDKEIESARRAKEEIEAEEKKAKEEAKQKAKEEAKRALNFKKGAKKARNEIFSENHHIYADDTDFKYDVLLTKIDTRNNRNERWALTIYESNSEPYTYAMNAQSAGTGKPQQNKILAAIGCGFPNALHAFKKTFREKTGVEWEDRISFAIERAKREKRDRGQGTGSDVGTQKGVPVSDSGAGGSGGQEEEDFAAAPFQYHPPAYGPRGTLLANENEISHETGPPVLQNQTKGEGTEGGKVEAWMSSAHGDAPGAQPDDISAAASQDAAQMEIDLDALMDEVIRDVNGETTGIEESFEYPFGNDNFFLDRAASKQDVLAEDGPLNSTADLQDSFGTGTQEVGETQLAEKAQGEFMELMEMPNPGNIDQEYGSTVKLPQLDLGSSILGKRKDAPVEDFPMAKKQKEAEVQDSFGGESYLLDGANAQGEVDIPRMLLDEANGTPDEQLWAESQLADGEEVQVV